MWRYFVPFFYLLSIFVLPQKEQDSLFLVVDRLRQIIGGKLQLVSCQKLCSSVRLFCFYINSQTFKKAKIELLPNAKTFQNRLIVRNLLEPSSSAYQALN
jgi:hypothetical protein